MAGVGVDYLGYTFDDGLGLESLQLLLVPLAARYEAEGLPTVADRLRSQADALLKLYQQRHDRLKLRGQFSPPDPQQHVLLQVYSWGH